MPLKTFALMLIVVIIAAGITIWLLTSNGPIVMAISLPLFLIAYIALRKFNK